MWHIWINMDKVANEKKEDNIVIWGLVTSTVEALGLDTQIIQMQPDMGNITLK